jgi:hypothetical protein
MKSALTEVVRSVSGGKAGVFAEIYSDTKGGGPEEAVAYRFDGTIGDSGNPDRTVSIAAAVATGDATYLDLAFTGTGGQKAQVAQCYYTEDNFCPISWFRNQGLWGSGVPSADDIWSRNCYEGSSPVWKSTGVASMAWRTTRRFSTNAP